VDAQKADQTITVTQHAPASAIFSTSFSVAATGGGSGNAVTFLSSGSCSNSGSFFTMTSGIGTCSVRYDQLGNGNYNDAAQVTESVTAQKAGQSISFGPLPDKTFGDPDFTVSATASSGLTVSFGASGQCTVSGSTVHLTGVGSCTITASQGGDDNYSAATDVPQTFQINSAGPPPPVSMITDASIPCAQFADGSASPLTTILYDRGKNKKISAVSPIAAVYWVRVPASNGPNTFTINQVITTGNFTRTLDLDSASAFTTACGAGPSPTASQGPNGALTVSFNASSAGTYLLAVTYSTLSVKGQKLPSPSTVHYDFSTQGVSSSTNGLDLSPLPASAHRTKHLNRFYFWRLLRH